MAQLPYQLPVTEGLYVADYGIQVAVSLPAAADGMCLATTSAVDSGKDYAWLADHLVVSNTSVSKSIAKVFIGEPGDTMVADLVAGTSTGNLDFDDVAGVGLFVQSGRAITILWQNCSLGAVGTFRVQYRRLRES